MQVIGLCRFSYPAIGGFQVEHDSIEERIAYLYDETRLAQRFALFQNVALPCLRAQTDQDFTFIIVIGESLPEQHIARLLQITKDIPQIQIQAHPPLPQRQIMKRVLQDARISPHEPCLQFRHDDDDAVAVNFIERLRKAQRDSATLCAQHRAVAFDFNMGYIAEFNASGIAASEIYRPFNVAALGMYVKGNDPLTIMNFAHDKLPRFMPAVSFPDERMFVRAHHAFNDARQKKVKHIPVEPLSEDQELEFLKRFAINADHIRETFA
ncbi:putative rhamnosyl transferase [Planktotalea sp.]|uniref:putative rhamnosyl transferase n=1 Tax=Planktotalea sp. TaxID=2029877 RepID=UPI003298DDAB